MLRLPLLILCILSIIVKHVCN